MDYVSQRRQDVLKGCKQNGVDALLVTDPVNVTYLSGFTGDSSFLICGPKQFTLVTDARFEAQAAEEVRGIELHVRPHDKTTPDATAELLTKQGYKAVGLEAGHCTLELAEAMKAKATKATFAPVAGVVEALRAIKDPAEVEAIRAAIKIAERAFLMFKATLRETDTEKDMTDALEGYIRRAGAACSSFPPIVAVGDRGALPHAKPTGRLLGDGSKLLVDWGADLGYKADLTRTFRSPFQTAPTRRNKQERTGHDFDKVFELVCAAQDAAVAAVRHGVPAKDVDAAARKVLAKGGYEEYFTHGLGHGLGLAVHEFPRVRANSPDTLETGMVITLEPGVYIPEWGGVRVEDDFLVTKDGAKRLTTLPREVSAIE